MDDHLFAFHDAHYMMALAAAGRGNDVDQMLRSMADAAARDDTTEGPIFREIGLPLSQAIVAARRGEYGKVVDLLLPIRYQVYRIGGSHAQRDVFAQLLLHAAIADGRHALARALLGERLERRAGSSLNWRWLGETLDGLGDTGGAESARGKAAALVAA